MKLDIVHYTQEEALRLGAALTKLGVPCFGPETGIKLLEIVVALDKVMEKNKGKFNEEMVTLLTGYRHRLTDVSFVAAGQQGEVIRQLEEAFGKG